MIGGFRCSERTIAGNYWGGRKRLDGAVLAGVSTGGANSEALIHDAKVFGVRYGIGASPEGTATGPLIVGGRGHQKRFETGWRGAGMSPADHFIPSGRGLLENVIRDSVIRIARHIVGRHGRGKRTWASFIPRRTLRGPAAVRRRGPRGWLCREGSRGRDNM